MNILAIIFPVFGVIGLGWLARQFNLLKPAAATSFNRFVFYIALPFLILQGILNLDRGQLLNWRLVLANVAAMAGLMLLAWLVTAKLLRLRPAVVAMYLMAAYFGNVAYIGIPLNRLAYGMTGEALAAFVSVIAVLFAVLVGLGTLQAVVSGGRFQLRHALAGAAQQPIIWAALAGLAIVLTGVHLPTAGINLINLLAQVAGPLALFSLGMFVHENKFSGDWKAIILLSIFNLLALPAAVFLFGGWLGLTGLPLKVSIIQAGMPIAVTNFVFSQQFHIAEKQISQAIVLSVLLAPLTLSLLLKLAEQL